MPPCDWPQEVLYVEGRGGLKTKVREAGARVKMWLDVHLLKTRPKHLGEPVSLPDWD